MLGTLGMREVNRTGDLGRGPAVTAVVLGVLATLVWLFLIFMPEAVAYLVFWLFG